MTIIKADDFEKIQQNELTLTEFKEKEQSERNYTQSHFRIKEKLLEASKAVTFSPLEELHLLRENLELAKNYFGLAEKEVQRLRSEIDGDKGVQRLQGEIALKDTRLAEQELKIKNLETLLQEQITIVVTKENEVKNLTETKDNEIKNLTAELQRLQHENSGLHRSVEKSDVREDDLLKQLDYVKDTNVLLTKENATLKSDKRQAEGRITALDATIQRLQDERKSLIEAREVAVQEMNRIISSYSAEQEKNIQLEYKFKRAEQEFRNMQNELQEAQNVISSVEALVTQNKKTKVLISDKH
ncbi:hypothetical protein RDn1_206 [Candidatus Termititenax dinenymphae]|uniref:Uncharacterized protein n=1 Tax=Candidatus Termititenax dinenymphae TaxID=2218523 RepID=A0A388TJQ2_9BACT|nr:hypothetical protein RDn1_206 [Candidatus Termititenax dinenymphae]